MKGITAAHKSIWNQEPENVEAEMVFRKKKNKEPTQHQISFYSTSLKKVSRICSNTTADVSHPLYVGVD